MPIVRVEDKLVYFAHVPKCAGSAVENYLKERFGKVAFIDRQFSLREPRWYRSSPQHIPAATVSLLFPQGFFDASFTVVRNPVERLISVYHHNQTVSKLIPQGMSFSEWLRSIPSALGHNGWVFDNHVRPTYHFIPKGSVFFRLEDGLERVVAYIDKLAGNREGPRSIAPALQRDDKAEKIIPSDEDLALISREYARDFQIFGYENRSRA